MAKPSLAGRASAILYKPYWLNPSVIKFTEGAEGAEGAEGNEGNEGNEVVTTSLFFFAPSREESGWYSY